jgi:hypothetical protein
MAERLKERLHQALVDFKKEKVWRQNARLSLANCTQDNPTMPYRKVLCSVSGNYRPPIERGKAAPKLKIIEEVITEEDESIHEDTSDEGEVVPSDQMTINERRIDWPSNNPTACSSRSSLDNSMLMGVSRSNDDRLSCSALVDDDSNINYKRLSVCSDNVSVVTTETTVILDPDMSVDPSCLTTAPQTIFISEGQLIDVSSDPRPRPMPAPRHSLGKLASGSSDGCSPTTNNTSICEINIENGCDPGTGNCGSSDEDEEEDVVVNYLDKMSITQEGRLLVDNPQLRANSYSSHSPDSHQFSTKSDSSVVGDNDEIEDEEDACNNDEERNEVVVIGRSSVVVDSKLSKADQDTISDESGYSEESNAISNMNCPLSSSTSPEVTVKLMDKNFAKDNINGSDINTPSNVLTSKLYIEENKILISQEKSDRVSYDTELEDTKEQNESSIKGKLNNETPIQEDPTVHGVLISEFSTSERLKYLGRSRQSSLDREHSSSTAPPDFFQNKIQEFVINI